MPHYNFVSQIEKTVGFIFLSLNDETINKRYACARKSVFVENMHKHFFGKSTISESTELFGSTQSNS